MDCFDLRKWPEFLTSVKPSAEPAWVDQITTDSRDIGSSQALFVALQGNQDGHSYVEHAMRNGAKYAIVSHSWQPDPSLDLSKIVLIRVDSPLLALQSLAKTYRTSKKAFVIGIAGSYGKTMVKDLLQKMLSKQFNVTASPGSFNSQIGVPLSLFTIKDNHEIALIEAAISEKNEMEALASMIMPDATIIAPIGKKHLATLKDLETAENETISLLKYTKPEGWTLLPQALHNKYKLQKVHPCIYDWDHTPDGLPHAYLLSQKAEPILPYCIAFPDGKTYEGMITAGFYYFLNLINMTAKAAWLLKIPSETIMEVIKDYFPEPIRTEIWKSEQGALFINDRYCADPHSIDQALKLYEQSPGGRKIFLFGGMRGKKSDEGKTLDYKRVGHALQHQNIDLLYLVGPHPFKALLEEVHQHSPKTSILYFDSYEKAFSTLRTELKPLDCVLVKGENKIPLDLLMHTFNDSICSNQCTINLDAIRSNIARLRSHLPSNTRLMAMVKAFAYGTGELQLAKFLKHCAVDILGVSTVDEGVALKKAKVPQAIFVINAAIYEAAKVVKWNFEVAVSDAQMLEALANEAEKQKKRVRIHLHVNTGMGRFGCRPEETLSLGRFIVNSPYLELEGVMTHFAVADCAAQDEFTLQQVKVFDNVIEELSHNGITAKWYHAANSSAVMRFNFKQYNMVRVGLALYGLNTSDVSLKNIELQQALCLTSRIVGINVCKAGESISYGRSYVVSKEEQRIAILPLGYFDGLHRNYSNKGYVMIRGVRAPMIGKICMDFMMIDISEIPEVKVGDPVLIFGEDEYGQLLPPEEFARQGDSIVHELITCLGPRIQRLFIHEERS